MKIVSPNTSEQIEIKIIPRANATSVVVNVRNEATKEVLSYNVTPTFTSNYMVLNGLFLFSENQQYLMEVYDGSDLIYRDLVFCTAQELDKYDINSERFEQATTTPTTYKF